MGGTDKAKTQRQVEFGDRVRSRRQTLGMSQEALALKAGSTGPTSPAWRLGGGTRAWTFSPVSPPHWKSTLAELVPGLQAAQGR